MMMIKKESQRAVELRSFPSFLFFPHFETARNNRPLFKNRACFVCVVCFPRPDIAHLAVSNQSQCSSMFFFVCLFVLMPFLLKNK